MGDATYVSVPTYVTEQYVNFVHFGPPIYSPPETISYQVPGTEEAEVAKKSLFLRVYSSVIDLGGGNRG